MKPARSTERNLIMGLDMYLIGEVFFCGARTRGEPKGEYYHLGYWRKHPNLHGYIVRHFADNEDKCQRIELTADDIRQIIDAVKARLLPQTTGFFFGKSDGSEYESDLEILTAALAWLEAEVPPMQWRSVYYQASW